MYSMSMKSNRYNLYSKKVHASTFIDSIEANTPEHALDIWVKMSQSTFRDWKTFAMAGCLGYEVCNNTIVINHTWEIKE